MFDVQELTSQISAHGGLASPSKFTLQVFMQNNGIDGRYIESFCDAATLPGLQVVTANVRRFGYGPVTEVPISAIYEPVDLTVMCDNGGVMETFFTEWNQRVINSNYEPGGAVAGTSATGNYPFQVSYVADYAARVVISAYTQEGQLISATTLHEAYPRSVGSIQLGWAMQNEIKRLPVSLAYVSWTSDFMGENSGGTPVL